MFKKHWLKECEFVQHFYTCQQRKKWTLFTFQVQFCYFVNLMVRAVAFLIYIYLYIIAYPTETGLFAIAASRAKYFSIAVNLSSLFPLPAPKP